MRIRDNSAWDTTRRLINSMGDSGDDYVRAVDICLGRRRASLDVRADSNSRTLENEDFKREVYSTVVSVLVKNYEVSSLPKRRLYTLPSLRPVKITEVHECL